jgi:flagellar basal body-associated protein FliL
MKLYARIWLAIVVTIAVFALATGSLVRYFTEHQREHFRDQIRERG